jgi:hypothetical protein
MCHASAKRFNPLKVRFWIENISLNINNYYFDSNFNYQILANKCLVIIKDSEFVRISCNSAQNVTIVTVYIAHEV